MKKIRFTEISFSIDIDYYSFETRYLYLRSYVPDILFL